MDIHSRDEWERLGTELRKRRGELGYGSRERKRFAADTGLHYRLVQRIETGERDGYPPETLAQVESAYRLARDALGAYFTTGFLEIMKAGTAEGAPSSLAARDEFEEHILASDRLSYSEKAAEIRDHREHIAREARKLAELGIVPPAFLRGGVRHLAGESASNDEARGA